MRERDGYFLWRLFYRHIFTLHCTTYYFIFYVYFEGSLVAGLQIDMDWILLLCMLPWSSGLKLYFSTFYFKVRFIRFFAFIVNFILNQFWYVNEIWINSFIFFGPVRGIGFFLAEHTLQYLNCIHHKCIHAFKMITS